MEKGLDKVYLTRLKELYAMEKEQAQLLPVLLRYTTNKELRAAIKEHWYDTQRHFSRCIEIMRRYGDANVTASVSEPMKKLLEEAHALVLQGNEEHAANLTMILQKIEHLEIASYSSAIMCAKILGYKSDGVILQKSLDEEYDQDNRLEKISEEIFMALV
jgi:ferritin-like metal-binding protein YciE